MSRNDDFDLREMSRPVKAGPKHQLKLWKIVILLR